METKVVIPDVKEKTETGNHFLTIDKTGAQKSRTKNEPIVNQQ